MLPQPLLHQLHELRLRGMAAALEQQLTTQASNELTFDERLFCFVALGDVPAPDRAYCGGGGAPSVMPPAAPITACGSSASRV